MNPILRKITTTPEKGVVTLSCGHSLSTKAVAAWHGGKPQHPWTPCPACGAIRAGRAIAGQLGRAVGPAVLQRILEAR